MTICKMYHYQVFSLTSSSDFVKTETDRVKKLLTGKISAEKKENLEEKLNILKSFTSLKVPAKDEL